jgi:hypothetical protein
MFCDPQLKQKPYFRREFMNRITTLLTALFVVLLATNALADYRTLDHNKHVFFHMANNALYQGEDKDYFTGTDDPQTYYIKADGGGLNQLHITTDLDNLYGQNTTTNNMSGSFWITTTGGRGYNDDIILMISVKGTIDPNFSVNIKSSGYTWYPNYGDGNYPSNPGTHTANVFDTTFYKSDFLDGYFSYPYKPGPGILDTWSLPLFSAQTDFTTNETLLFIDLKRSNMTETAQTGDLTDDGAVKVEYSFSNMNTSASFNAYGWCKYSNQGQGINWTQNTLGTTGTSSYTVNY